jgi:hypothetical protein
LQATLSDISIISHLANDDCLRDIREAVDDVDKRVRNALLKSAAAFETITRARGAYKAAPKRHDRPKSFSLPVAMSR